MSEALAPAREAVTAAADQAKAEQLDLLGDQGKAAIEDLPDLSDAEDYLPLPDRAEIMAIQREIGGDIQQAVHEHRRRGGKGGRKAGSSYRRSKEFRAFMLSLGPHPGAVLQRLMGQSTELLAHQLGCSKEKAADKQIRIAAELMPYFEGKMPVSVNLTVKGDFSLVAGAGTGLFDGIEDAEFDELPELGFSERNQDDSADDKGASE